MIYYDPHFRSDVILSALLQAFIFVLQSLEKIYIFGLCGIFGCSTSNDHWKKCQAAKLSVWYPALAMHIWCGGMCGHETSVRTNKVLHLVFSLFSF